MKKEFLTGLLPDADAAVIDQIMAEYEKSVEAQKNAVASLTTERDGLKAQLAEAGNEIKSYKDMDIEGIKKKAAEWETKYNTDTEALKTQLSEAQYGFAVKDSVSAMRFTSASAKKAFVADLTAKKLPLQEGKLLGLDDFVKEYKESDPGAFAPDEEDKTPVFSRGTSGGGAPGASAAIRAAFGLPEKSN